MFIWLRDPRFAPNEAAVEEPMGVLPVEVIEERQEVRRDAGAPASTAEGRIELGLLGGHRLRVVGSYDPEALARLIRGQPGDPGAPGHAGVAGSGGVAGGGCDGHAAGRLLAGGAAETALGLDPFAGPLFVFRGRQGDLIEVIWFGGQGSCLFATRLKKGRFVRPAASGQRPAASEGKVAPTPAQMGMLLEDLQECSRQRG